MYGVPQQGHLQGQNTRFFHNRVNPITLYKQKIFHFLLCLAHGINLVLSYFLYIWNAVGNILLNKEKKRILMTKGKHVHMI